MLSYDAPKKMDLSSDLQQAVKPDMTGPMGAKIFDKAIMFKSKAT